MTVRAILWAGLICLAAPLHAQTYEEARQAYLNGEYAQALQIARDLANAGDALGLNMMGSIYEQGYGVEADPARAIAYYEESIRLGEVRAMANLGDLYLQGWEGQDPLPELAIPLLEQARDLGNTGALNTIGTAHLRGHYGAPDPLRAMEFYRRAHEAGHADATANLAWLSYEGEGVPVDHDRARRLFLEAHARGGPVWATEYLGDMWRLGEGGPEDLSEAVRYYEAAAERGSAYAANWLGYYYDNGLAGLPVDHERAIELFTLAAEQDNVTGLYNMGSMYDGGRGVEEDNEIAADYYARAAAMGDADATYELAAMYWHGELGYSDLVEARRLMQIAVDLGDDLAPGDLGLMVRNGIGGARDLGLAVEMFLRGVEEDDALAYVNIGEVISSPDYAEQDRVMGYAYCLRAIDLAGSDDSAAQYTNRCRRLAQQLTAEEQAEGRRLAPSL